MDTKSRQAIQEVQISEAACSMPAAPVIKCIEIEPGLEFLELETDRTQKCAEEDRPELVQQAFVEVCEPSLVAGGVSCKAKATSSLKNHRAVERQSISLILGFMRGRRADSHEDPSSKYSLKSSC